jgi:hypothetical protein
MASFSGALKLSGEERKMRYGKVTANILKKVLVAKILEVAAAAGFGG